MRYTAPCCTSLTLFKIEVIILHLALQVQRSHIIKKSDGSQYLQAKIILPRPKARRKDYYVVTRPDIDNLLKAIMDVLSQVRVWHDDAQVVRLEAEKIYQAEDLACGAEIEIYEGVEDE